METKASVVDVSGTDIRGSGTAEKIAGGRPFWHGFVKTIVLIAALITPTLQYVHAEVQTSILQQCGLGTLTCVAISPDGRYIATGGGGGAVLWNTETGSVVRMFFVPGVKVNSVAFSPDGSKLFTGDIEPYTYNQATAKLWNVNTGTLIQAFSEPTIYSYDSVAYSHDGTKVLAGSNADGVAVLWDAVSGAMIQTFSQRTGSVAISPDGTKVLTGSSIDGTAKLWDAATGTELHTFAGHTDIIKSVAFSPDGNMVLTGSADNTAKLWDATTGAVITSYIGHANYVMSVAFSPDGTRVLTGSVDTTAKLWDTATGAEVQSLSGHRNSVLSVAFSFDGTKLLTGSFDQTAIIWAASTGNPIHTFSGHTSIINSFAISPDGETVLTGGYNSEALIWTINTGYRIRSLLPPTQNVIDSVAFSPDGTQVLTTEYFDTHLRDALTGSVLQTFSGHSNFVTAVAFSPDGKKVLTGSADNTAKLWSATTGALIQTFSGHTSGVKAVAYSPDGTSVLTADPNGTAKLWDVATGTEVWNLLGDGARSLVFSANGTKILVGYDDGTAKLWDISIRTLIQTFSKHAYPVSSVAISKDGTRVLTGGSYEGTVRLWNAATGGLLRTFSGHTNKIVAVAFSRDEKKALSASWDGTTKIWELNPPRAIIVAGGGDFVGNGIAEQTGDLGAYAFLTLKRRGYAGENIKYLTAFGPTDPENQNIPFRDADGDGLNDVDGWSTLENLKEAITGSFGSGAGRLLIMMIDHGYRTQDFMAFRLNPTQSLPSTTLDGWLDDLQTSSSTEVTLVVDSCYSGQIAEDCKLTTQEQNGTAGQ